MRFRLWFFMFSIVSVALLSRCGPVSDDEVVFGPNDTVGDPIQFLTASLIEQNFSTGKSSFAFYDQTARRIYEVDMVQNKIINQYPLVARQDYKIVAGNSGEYYLAFYANKVIQVSSQGSKEILELNSEIKSFSFESDQNLLVVSDLSKSLGIARIDLDPSKTKVYLGGIKLDGTNILKSGVIHSSGQLLGILSNQVFIEVDLNQTLEDQKLVEVHHILPEGLEEINWLGEVEGSESGLLLHSADNRIISYDYQTESIVDQQQAEGNLISRHRKKNAHIYVGTSESSNIFYVGSDGMIVRSALPRTQGLVKQSVFDLSSDVITGTVQNFTADGETDGLQTAFVLRFSDNFLVASKEYESEAQVVVSSEFVGARFPSSLGFVEIYDVDKKVVNEIKNFNAALILE